jgi:hypothetical protein
MSRLATLVITAILGIYIVHGPRGAAVSPGSEWLALASATAAAPGLVRPQFTLASLPLAMGPDSGAEFGTQATWDGTIAAANTGIVRASGRAVPARSVEKAQYKTQLRECDALDGDARNHCIEYVKLRSRRS